MFTTNFLERPTVRGLDSPPPQKNHVQGTRSPSNLTFVLRLSSCLQSTPQDKPTVGVYFIVHFSLSKSLSTASCSTMGQAVGALTNESSDLINDFRDRGSASLRYLFAQHGFYSLSILLTGNGRTELSAPLSLMALFDKTPVFI